MMANMNNHQFLVDVSVKYVYDMRFTIASYGCESILNHCRNCISNILLCPTTQSST